MSIGFPQNPKHGTIYEPQLGVLYIYDIVTRTWVRTEGGIPGLATPLADGLMSSGDLYKLNRIVIPPPQATLTAGDCMGVLNGGIIEFRVGDQFLTIEGTAKLMNEVAGIGAAEAQIVTRELHQHTNSFDFRVDTDIFYEYMESTGKFRVITTKGRTGPPGNLGLPGKDDLPYGKKGPDGDPGANAPFDVALEVDPISLEKKSSSYRAIVAFGVENVSEDENYLVAHRATVGNPSACPADIRLTSSLKSTWVVCMPPTLTDSSLSSEECFVCTGDLYYLDLAFILKSIENEFDREVRNLKNGMESIVAFWMTVMSGVFDEQKAALCCAIEYCRSQSRNQDTRRYIEQSRILAAQSDHSIIIEGDPDANTKSVTIMEPSCLPDGFGTDNKYGLPNNQDPLGGTHCVPWIMIDEEGKPIKYAACPAGFTPRDVYRDYIISLENGTGAVSGQARTDRLIAEILSKPIEETRVIQTNIGELFAEKVEPVRAPIPLPTSLDLTVDPLKKTATEELAKGRYRVDITGLIEVDGQFTGGVTIRYTTPTGPKVRRIPDILSTDKEELAKAYRSLSVQVDHDGGPIAVGLDAPEYATGSLKVSFVSGKKAAKKQDKVFKLLKRPVSEVTPAAMGQLSAGYCEITSDYLRWYEKCWKQRNCSGAVIEVAGQDFVLIYQKDSKIICGPAAIAWPTLDGENFVPSTGKIMFCHLMKLEQKALKLLSAGKYRAKIGDLKDITTIYFPLS